MPMTLEQARKMVKGTLKGNSAMAKAIRELTGGAAPRVDENEPASEDMSERGSHTLQAMQAREESW